MGNPAKLPEIRKEAFSQARESLGLSAKDLAGMACLSVRQIQQIENGESSSFYGAQIKVTAAKKVANLLGLKESEAFICEPQVKAKGEAVKEEASKQEAIKQVTAPELVVEEPIKTRSKTPVSAAPISSLSSVKKVKSSPQKRWVIWLSLVAAVAFSVINLRPLFFPEKVEEIIVVKEEVIEPVPAPAPSEPVVVTTPAPASLPASAIVSGATDIAGACPAEDSPVINYKPDAPRKPADVVYAQAKSKQIVCVIDATGKNQNKTVESGAGASFYGKPPFKVLTGGLNQVDLYFQGAKVRLANINTKIVVLEAADLVTPSAQSDSELR